jgi:hypothetical protein
MFKTYGIILFVIFFASCSLKKSHEGNSEEPKVSGLSGKELANIHCSGCHLFPDPNLLTKEIWMNSVLPKMGLRLGMVDYFNEMTRMSVEEMELLLKNDIYKTYKVMHQDDWQKVLNYYVDNAPDSLEFKEIKTSHQLTNFDLDVLGYEGNEIVMTKFDSKEKKIVAAEAFSKNLVEITNNKVDSIKISNDYPIVDFANHSKYGRVWLEIGNMNPNDKSQGTLRNAEKVLINGLKRPVDLLLADINEDGTEDFVISNFGNYLGHLSWYDGLTFQAHLLYNQPGARVSYNVDFDKDGKKDIISLFTQGKESIVLFKNIGNENFETIPLIEFPPSYGSSFFELVDFNNDQHLDIIHSSGDNADLSIILKPYHGIWILINDGKQGFNQKYFFHQNGASKAIARDFDNDGDLDLASISFFPKKDNNEGFLYLENKGNFEFKAFKKKGVSNFKYLTLDAGDFDNDGDLDLILGRFDRSPESRMKKTKNIFILFNKLN